MIRCRRPAALRAVPRDRAIPISAQCSELLDCLEVRPRAGAARRQLPVLAPLRHADARRQRPELDADRK
jgi:hypothetical protein